MELYSSSPVAVLGALRPRSFVKLINESHSKYKNNCHELGTAKYSMVQWGGEQGARLSVCTKGGGLKASL